MINEQAFGFAFVDVFNLKWINVLAIISKGWYGQPCFLVDFFVAEAKVIEVLVWRGLWQLYVQHFFGSQATQVIGFLRVSEFKYLYWRYL